MEVEEIDGGTRDKSLMQLLADWISKYMVMDVLIVTHDRILLILPFFCPSNDAINVFVLHDAETSTITFTDVGMIMEELEVHGIDLESITKNKYFQRILRRYKIELADTVFFLEREVKINQEEILDQITSIQTGNSEDPLKEAFFEYVQGLIQILAFAEKDPYF